MNGTSAAGWPAEREALATLQADLARRTPDPWQVPSDRPVAVGGCFCCFARGVAGPGAAGDRLWVAAVTVVSGSRSATAVVDGEAGAPYEAGLLALREGPVLERVVRRLTTRPDVLLVDATGRDHPRGAGLATHLGAVLDLPTVGVTHRPLLAHGSWPADVAGAASPVWRDGESVGAWLRTRAGRRPLVVHAGWRTTPDVAVETVRLVAGTRRTPRPLREARRLAREARATAA